MQLGVASLHPPQENCFSLFCPTCPMAHRCDASCGYCRSNLSNVIFNDVTPKMGIAHFDTSMQCAYRKCMAQVRFCCVVQ